MMAKYINLQSLLCCFLLIGAQPVFSNEFTTDTVVDENDMNPGDGICASTTNQCSLRAAIEEANALLGDHSINIIAGIYRLTIEGRDENAARTGDLDTLANITFNGAGAVSTIINGNLIDRIFDIRPGSIVNLNQLSITNASVKIQDVNNVYQDGGLGGGAYNGGKLYLNDVWVYGNAALGGGGGIYSQTSYLELNHSIIYANNSTSGAGLGLSNGGTEINDSFILFNPPTNFAPAFLGGGIFSFSNLTIRNSVISNNSSQINGGGIYHGIGELDISNTTISGNYARRNGGGIYYRMGPIGSSTILQPSLTHVTITDNIANGVDTSPNGEPIVSFFPGAGSFTFPSNGQVIDFSVPVGDSEGSLLGGGIVVTGQVNSGQRPVEMTVINSIIANNYTFVTKTTLNDCAFTTEGSIKSIGGNMDSNASCGFNQNSDRPASDPQFNTFTIDKFPGNSNTKPNLTQLEFDNLKPHTQTVAVTSPAIDNAVDQHCTSIDQLGRARPAFNCDIGAYEVLPPTATPMQYVTQASGVIQAVFTVRYGEDLDYTFELVDQPAQGNVGFATATDNVDGNWIYTANASASGNDLFTYRTCLADGTCSAPANIGIIFETAQVVNSEVSITIAAGTGSTSEITIIEENQLIAEVADVDYNFPLGTFFFDVEDTSANVADTLSLTIQLPANTNIQTGAVVRKLDKTGVWQTLGTTINTTVSSAVINAVSKTITLNLIDNDIFDSNPAIGMIRDPIAFAIPKDQVYQPIVENKPPVNNNSDNSNNTDMTGKTSGSINGYLWFILFSTLIISRRRTLI